MAGNTVNPRLLVQKLARMCQMSVGSVHSTLHELQLYPYRVAIWQESKHTYNAH